MYRSLAAMDAQRGACLTPKITKMVILSVIIALAMTSTLGTTTENYNVPTTNFGNSGAVNATLNWTSNDPCSNYTILSESWRNVNAFQSSTTHCDDQLSNGLWYRFMPPAGNAIPEAIPPVYSCGTSAPMWLNGAHPRNVSSTPVQRQLCANWDGDTCQWSTIVLVALCPGGYYVYKAPLTAAPICNLAVCAVDTNGNATQAAICQRQGDFYCSLSQSCVSYNYRCDDYPHCIYGEDETGCANSSIVPSSDTSNESINDFFFGGAVVSSSCGGTLYGFGVVRSPYFSSNYGNNLNCNWTLIASPYNASVVLAFSNFSTEPCCDYLSIYNRSGALVTRFSGTFVPSIIVLPNTAVISFTTDGSVVSSGFSVWFTSSDVSATNLSSRSSCESQGNFYCSSSFLCVPMSYRCNGVTTCYNGEDESGCSTTAPPPRPTTLSARDSCERQGKFYCVSSSSCISMSYRCNGYSECYYGEDEVGCITVAPSPTTASLSSCGGTLYGSGYVRSPYYPSSYSNNLNCTWTLYASPNYGSIVLQFNDLNTESCCDFLSISNSSGALVNRYSGTIYPNSIVLGSTAVVRFTSDSSVTYAGFSIWFSTSVATTTTLSPRDSCEQQGYFYCGLSNLCIASWRRCDGYTYCSYGEDEAGCTSSSTSPASLSSCGGTLYGSGYVRSPFYPSSYSNNLNCTWTLYASPYYGSIVLQFNDLNTESCCDFLSIYNSSGALVNRYSGTTYPNSIVLGSTAVVRFTTDSSLTYNGFSIWFSTSVAPTTTLSPRDSCEQQGYFYCGLSNLCIASWRRCDGYAYCSYGEDEAGCTSSSTSPSVTPSQRDSCLRQGNFYCEFSRDCIAMWRRCDGYAYCYYGEDESGCGSTTATAPPVIAASEQPGGSFIAASGNAQLFLQISKSSASELPRGSWIVLSVYVTALLLGLPDFDLH